MAVTLETELQSLMFSSQIPDIVIGTSDDRAISAFVMMYHTDFSSGRKEMIKRDMAYSNDEKQIREILAAEIADNVKKGWEEV